MNVRFVPLALIAPTKQAHQLHLLYQAPMLKLEPLGSQRLSQVHYGSVSRKSQLLAEMRQELWRDQEALIGMLQLHLAKSAQSILSVQAIRVKQRLLVPEGSMLQ